MAEIRPFRAVRYNPDVAGDVSLNVCPPFDVITPQLQQELYARSKYNIVRLELANPVIGSQGALLREPTTLAFERPTPRRRVLGHSQRSKGGWLD